jgi:multidrug efflux pump subunit AcrA (membrane-fusion protein)
MVVVLSVLVAALPFARFDSTAVPDDAQWVSVQPQPLTVQLGLLGRIEAGSQRLLSAPFDGTLLALNVAEGDRVERGQSLLVLDTAQVDIQRREALAQLLKARRVVADLSGWEQGQEVARARRTLMNARLNHAQTVRQTGETRALFERGIVPRMELDALDRQAQVQRVDLSAAEAELQQVLGQGRGEALQIARMELANAQARHDALQAQFDAREVRAPFAGIVVRLPDSREADNNQPIQPGLRVTSGQPLLGLASLERLSVRAVVDEVDIAQLQAGQAVQVEGDGFDGVQLHGRISRIGDQALTSASPGGGVGYALQVLLDPLDDAQKRRLRLGMSARLSIAIYSNPAAMLVPGEAVVEQQGLYYLDYRGGEGEPVQRLPVTLGRSTARGLEIFGLPAGEIRRPRASET